MVEVNVRRGLAWVLSNQYLHREEHEITEWVELLSAYIDTWSNEQLVWCYDLVYEFANGADFQRKMDIADEVNAALLGRKFPEGLEQSGDE